MKTSFVAILAIFALVGCSSELEDSRDNVGSASPSSESASPSAENASLDLSASWTICGPMVSNAEYGTITGTSSAQFVQEGDALALYTIDTQGKRIGNAFARGKLDIKTRVFLADLRYKHTESKGGPWLDYRKDSFRVVFSKDWKRYEGTSFFPGGGDRHNSGAVQDGMFACPEN
jgi:hypothetical protein